MVRYFLYPAYLVSEIKFYVDVDFQREWTCIFCLMKNKSGALVVTSSEDALYFRKIVEKGVGERALLCTLSPRVHTLPLPTKIAKGGGGRGCAAPFPPACQRLPPKPTQRNAADLPTGLAPPQSKQQPKTTMPVGSTLLAARRPTLPFSCRASSVTYSLISASPALRYAPMRTSCSNMDRPGIF